MYKTSLDDTDRVNFNSTCKSCDATLEVPWIRCAVCRPSIELCTRCFCFGIELGEHESDHAYSIVRFDFPLYEAGWSALEEIRLLEAIQEHGFGNWTAVAGRIGTKSAEDCERHYLKCYIDNPQKPLPEFSDQVPHNKGAPVTFKLSDNPPRPAENTLMCKEMGGYSAARCDFNDDYDNWIEYEISDITLEDIGANSDEDAMDDNNTDGGSCTAEEKFEAKQLYRDLELAVLDTYRNCLVERQKRKKIVRDYGLINIRKLNGILKRRYDQHLAFDFLRPFMKLFPSMTFDKYLESLLYEKLLKRDITQLQEFRSNGITKLRTIKHYHRMRQRRDNTKSYRHLLTDVLNHVTDETSCQVWLAKQATYDGSSKLPPLPIGAPRKAAPRLNIEDLPSYEKLNQQEKDFCSEVRLVPQAFLDFSKILITESTKLGALRLAEARRLIKIDVNKTRKLFDFLVLRGHIVKASA